MRPTLLTLLFVFTYSLTAQNSLNISLKGQSIFLNDMTIKIKNRIVIERNSFESFCFENMKKTENLYYFRRREYRF